MSATLISNQVTLKVNAAVSASTSTTGTTLYTGPSTGYAMVNICISGATSFNGNIKIGTRIVLDFPLSGTLHGSVPGSFNTAGSVSATSSSTFIVGPSQAVLFTITSGSATASISGVEFVNSP